MDPIRRLPTACIRWVERPQASKGLGNEAVAPAPVSLTLKVNPVCVPEHDGFTGGGFEVLGGGVLGVGPAMHRNQWTGLHPRRVRDQGQHAFRMQAILAVVRDVVETLAPLGPFARANVFVDASDRVVVRGSSFEPCFVVPFDNTDAPRREVLRPIEEPEERLHLLLLKGNALALCHGAFGMRRELLAVHHVPEKHDLIRLQVLADALGARYSLRVMMWEVSVRPENDELRGSVHATILPWRGM